MNKKPDQPTVIPPEYLKEQELVEQVAALQELHKLQREGFTPKKK